MDEKQKEELALTLAVAGVVLCISFWCGVLAFAITCVISTITKAIGVGILVVPVSWLCLMPTLGKKVVKDRLLKEIRDATKPDGV